ncbi:MAG: hypothetical protein ACKO0Z_06960 [Betaproteobacteria bacterium]
MSRNLEVLKRSREIITDPKNWTQYTMARNDIGDKTSYDDPRACKFCAMGAIYKASHEALVCYDPVRAEVKETLNKRGGPTTWITSFNDSDDRQHSEVLELFDETIRRLETT